MTRPRMASGTTAWTITLERAIKSAVLAPVITPATSASERELARPKKVSAAPGGEPDDEQDAAAHGSARHGGERDGGDERAAAEAHQEVAEFGGAAAQHAVGVGGQQGEVEGHGEHAVECDESDGEAHGGGLTEVLEAFANVFGGAAQDAHAALGFDAAGGADVDPEHLPDGEAEEDGGADEDPAGAEVFEHRACDGADHLGAELHHGGEGDGAEQGCAFDGVGQQRGLGGHFAGADDAGDDGDQHKVPEGDGAGKGERGEGEGGERRADAAEHYDAGAVVAVGQCAAERGEHPGADCGEGHRAARRRAAGEVVGDPAAGGDQRPEGDCGESGGVEELAVFARLHGGEEASQGGSGLGHCGRLRPLRGCCRTLPNARYAAWVGERKRAYASARR